MIPSIVSTDSYGVDTRSARRAWCRKSRSWFSLIEATDYARALHEAHPSLEVRVVRLLTWEQVVAAFRPARTNRGIV